MNLSERAERAERLALLKLEHASQPKVEFPLISLLRLYTQCHRPLSLQYFAGLKEIIKWLQPISASTYPLIYVPSYLLNYEMQEIALHTKNHISQIYQELTHLYTVDSSLGESNHVKSNTAEKDVTHSDS